jgi:hypothetical protein
MRFATNLCASGDERRKITPALDYFKKKNKAMSFCVAQHSGASMASDLVLFDCRAAKRPDPCFIFAGD